MSFMSHQEVVIGPNVIESLPELLKEWGRVNPLLISDSPSRSVVRVLKQHLKGKIPMQDEFLLSPGRSLSELIAEGVKLFSAGSYDAIIALGEPKSLHLAMALQQMVLEEVEPYIILIPTRPGVGGELHNTLWDSSFSGDQAQGALLRGPHRVFYDTAFLMAAPDTQLAAWAIHSLGLALDRLLFAEYTPAAPRELIEATLIEGIKEIYGNLYRALDSPRDPFFRTNLLRGIVLVQSVDRPEQLGEGETLCQTIQRVSGVPLGITIIPAILQQLDRDRSLDNRTKELVEELLLEIPLLGDAEDGATTPNTLTEREHLFLGLRQFLQGVRRKCGKQFPSTLRELNSPDTPYSISPEGFESIIEAMGVEKSSPSEERIGRTLLALYWGY